MDKWKAVKLSDMFTLQMGKTPSRDNSAYWNGTHKWVSIADLGKAANYITDTKECITDMAVSETGIKATPKDTVVMSFKLSIGKTAVTAEEIYTNEAIMSFIDKGIYDFDIDYIYHLFSCKDTFHVRAVFIVKNAVFSKSRAGENTRKMPLLRNRGTERSLHENRAYQAGKDHRYLV